MYMILYDCFMFIKNETWRGTFNLDVAQNYRKVCIFFFRKSSEIFSIFKTAVSEAGLIVNLFLGADRCSIKRMQVKIP